MDEPMDPRYQELKTLIGCTCPTIGILHIDAEEVIGKARTFEATVTCPRCHAEYKTYDKALIAGLG